jgi:hypothetical protein
VIEYLISMFPSELRVFGNRVLGGIFGPKRDEVTGIEEVA